MRTNFDMQEKVPYYKILYRILRKKAFKVKY